MQRTLEPSSTSVFPYSREETWLVEESTNQPLSERKGDVTLLFFDPVDVDADLDEHALLEGLKLCLKALKKGGSIAVPCDLGSLSLLSRALEAAGFKQLRFVQTVSESAETAFYPADNRNMMLMAVKGGGSTFNDVYNNGHYPRPGESSAKEDTPLLSADLSAEAFLASELVSVHSNPGDVIVATSARFRDVLSSLVFAGKITFRTKPVPPEKPAKRPEGAVS